MHRAVHFSKCSLPRAMHKLQLYGRNLGRVFNSGRDCVHAMHTFCPLIFGTKMAPNLWRADPSFRNSVTGSGSRAKCSNILLDIIYKRKSLTLYLVYRSTNTLSATVSTLYTTSSSAAPSTSPSPWCLTFKTFLSVICEFLW